ncbi:MAG TPA: hypothetical protein DEP66_04350 [Acidimicrobiaceae bacterium]|nr:hypothetical protein [Acidimicrobiaceae bacterium]HCB37432.1 hypothetical protein [Acidimicrobiaceae bacterium]
MTETPTTDVDGTQVIADALDTIDGALGAFLHRELVSSGEVTDVLLDVRSKLRQASDEAKGAAEQATDDQPVAIA